MNIQVDLEVKVMIEDEKHLRRTSCASSRANKSLMLHKITAIANVALYCRQIASFVNRLRTLMNLQIVLYSLAKRDCFYVVVAVIGR